MSVRLRGFASAFVPLAVVALTTLSVACSKTAGISTVYTALDSDGARRRNVFFTDTEAIHCVAEGGFGRQDATVEGRLHLIRAYDFDKNEFFVTDRFLGNAELNPSRTTDGVETKLDFTLSKVGSDGKDTAQAPYTAGSYECLIYLDGEFQKLTRFNVEFPPCPESFVVPSGTCFGFYPAKQVCPKYGTDSSAEQNCTCSEAAGWTCDEG